MISAETIALVKERTTLVALVGETVKLTAKGQSFVGLCPFHKEESPSFYVHPERGVFHCFGCKERGAAVDFVMKVKGCSFPEAIRALAKRAGVEVADSSTATAEEKPEAPAEAERDPLELRVERLEAELRALRAQVEKSLGG